MTRPARTALVLTIALLAACGGGGGGGEEALRGTYIDALTETLAEDGLANPQCVATRIVDLAGAGALDDAGVTPEELAAADALADLDVALPDDAVDRLTDSLLVCNVHGPFVTSFVDDWDRLVPGSETTDAARSCLSNAAVDPARQFFAETVISGDDTISDVDLLLLGVEMQFACPRATSDLLISMLEPTHGSISRQGKGCIENQVQDRREAIAELLLQDRDEPALLAFWDETVAPCADLL